MILNYNHINLYYHIHHIHILHSPKTQTPNNINGTIIPYQPPIPLYLTTIYT